MRRLAMVACWIGVVGCAATQEGVAPPDGRTIQDLNPDSGQPTSDAPAPSLDAPLADAFVAPIDAAPAPPVDAAVVPVPDGCVPNPLGELCNGVDDTCDGKVDEGFNLGQPCTVGLGACKRSGHLICSDDGKMAVCDAVPGNALPFDVCMNGIDDDCDGIVDNGFPDWGTICYNGVGDCKTAGLWVCNDKGDGLTCNAVPGKPGPELCGTGHDENCDGNVDEGFPELGQDCSVGVGHCKSNGIVICDPTDLTKTRCSAVKGDPEPETCNGVDDNCDGQIDEGDPQSGAECLTGAMGECGPGHLHCRQGLLACVPDNPPGVELCDGKDNDCDGIIDNGFDIGQPCNSTAPIDFCPNGHWECNGLHDHICVGDTPTPEVCNGKDDNCDGRVDEDWDFFNDPNNCGGCNHVCGNLNVDTRQCTGGACNPTCSFGWQSCDGSLDNGCESLRNTYGGALPNPNGTYAAVSGDEGQAPVTLAGYGETQIRIHVREDSDGFNNLHAQFRLQNPDGVDFHICVYSIGDGCHTNNFDCASPGGDQSIWASADETPWPLSCNDDSFDVNVAIVFDNANRSSCGNWVLTVYSNSDPPDGAPNIDVD